MDGEVVDAKFLCGWENSDRRYDGELDRICKELFNAPFESLRSMWISRLGTVSDYWHLIEFKKK